MGSRFSIIASVVLALAAVLTPAPSSPSVTAQGQVKIEWLGWMFYRFTSPNGVVVLASPFLTNRESPITLEQIDRADIILAPNAHSDDFGQSVEISNKTGGKVLAPEGFGEWMVARRGLNPANLIGTTPGRSHTIDGITIDIVRNDHDNTIRDDEPWEGGPAIGFILTFENGYTVYFAASSAPMDEMKSYAATYQPQLALVNAFNNTAPEFGDIVQFLTTDNPRLQTVIPTHRMAAAVEFYEYAYEVEQRGLPVTYFVPTIGQAYFY
jgi:L-ascorbate metabolism protein UlaG (beta-lactamase superfamily)